jgi:hypothetical protein
VRGSTRKVANFACRSASNCEKRRFASSGSFGLRVCVTIAPSFGNKVSRHPLPQPVHASFRMLGRTGRRQHRVSPLCITAGDLSAYSLFFFEVNTLGVEWCPRAESNHRHYDFQSHALPTELLGHPVPEAKALGRRGWCSAGSERVIARVFSLSSTPMTFQKNIRQLTHKADDGDQRTSLATHGGRELGVGSTADHPPSTSAATQIPLSCAPPRWALLPVRLPHRRAREWRRRRTASD